MTRRAGGFTMVEMLVVTLAVGVLGSMMFVSALNSREQARRSGCGNNLGQIIKCCHLYSDMTPQLGLFPMLADRNNADGCMAMAMLYPTLVKDYRVFECGSNPRNASILKPYLLSNPDTSVLVGGYTNYGYDPGHTPVHATPGVVSDRGMLDPKQHDNSMNHRGEGQNVAIGCGSVEWWDTADGHATKDANDKPVTDHIFKDNLDEWNLPEELETNLIL